MISRDELKLLLPTQLRHLPADLVAVVVMTLCATGAVFVPGVNETPLRVLFGLPLVLFVPGYVFIAALFPEAGSPSEKTVAAVAPMASSTPTESPSNRESTSSEAPVDADRSGIDGIERAALSVGTSIAIVPLLGLVLNATPWGFRLVPLMSAVVGFTLAATAVAARRRAVLPAGERFSVPYRAWLETVRGTLLQPDTRSDAALNVLLAVSVLLTLGSVSYAVAVPMQGEQFSELYLLTEDDDGELVADGYPSELVAGESTSVVVGIGNHEHEATEYTVVVQLQEVELVSGENQSANESATGSEIQVVEYEQIDEFSTQLQHNETAYHEHELRPTTTGEDLRIQYLLYEGEPPNDPSADTAYRSVSLWVDVQEGSVSDEPI